MQQQDLSSRAAAVRGVALTAIVVSLVSACSDATSVENRPPSELAFTTRSDVSSSNALASTIPITKNGHTLDLTAVTVVVDRASLKRDRTDVCRSDDDDDRKGHFGFFNCGEVRIGPTIVDLPLDGALVTLPGNAIPAGTYREIDVRVSMVRLEGTYDTKAFDVTIPVNAKAEVDFETPLVVVDTVPVSVTVNLPVNTWLVASDSSLVDPTKLLTTPSLMASVRWRISSSIRAFEDRDRDGRDDHRFKRGRGD
jgi:hypothetical protein